jgi:NDP-sugar pyrophosphorylase family protein
MKPISFIICAAGAGTRFRDLNLPKPLIKLNGRTLLERSLDSLEIQDGDQLIIIGRQDDQLSQHFGHLPHQIVWLETNVLTRGQLETSLLALDHILHDDIIIYNCDTYFQCSNLRNTINSGEFDGIIPCSIEEGSCWSFCKISEGNIVSEVAEKNPISPWASVGLYYFKGRKLFTDLAQQECEAVSGQEVYVAPLYNRYISHAKKISMLPTTEFKPFGTFEQVQKYWGLKREELIQQNR